MESILERGIERRRDTESGRERDGDADRKRDRETECWRDSKEPEGRRDSPENLTAR